MQFLSTPPANRRVHLLNEKISNLKVSQPLKVSETELKLQELQNTLEDMKVTMGEESFQIKQIIHSINQGLSFSFYQKDQILKEEIQRAEQFFIEATQTHRNQRKKHDARMAKFIDEKCHIIRDLIQLQIKQRQKEAAQLQESLESDLGEIKQKMDSGKTKSSITLQEIHSNFLNQYEKLHRDFQQFMEHQDQQESDFYRMLRDLLKKVKAQLTQDKIKREEMEESILTLIEKLCDKALEE